MIIGVCEEPGCGHATVDKRFCDHHEAQRGLDPARLEYEKAAAQKEQDAMDEKAFEALAAWRAVSSDEIANDRAYAAAAELLDKCKATSVGRAVEHGGVVIEWTHGAELLRWFLRAKYGVDVPVVAADYGLIMNLWKHVRIAVGEKNREDHYLDGSNYLALAWGVMQATKADK